MFKKKGSGKRSLKDKLAARKATQDTEGLKGRGTVAKGTYKAGGLHSGAKSGPLVASQDAAITAALLPKRKAQGMGSR